MLSGRFAQTIEAISVFFIIFGIVALCQSASFALYPYGFKFLVVGWLGLTIWSHRRAVRPLVAQGNPQITIDGHAPIEAVIDQGSRNA